MLKYIIDLCVPIKFHKNSEFHIKILNPKPKNSKCQNPNVK